MQSLSSHLKEQSLLKGAHLVEGGLQWHKNLLGGGSEIDIYIYTYKLTIHNHGTNSVFT